MDVCGQENEDDSGFVYDYYHRADPDSNNSWEGALGDAPVVQVSRSKLMVLLRCEQSMREVDLDLLC